MSWRFDEVWLDADIVWFRDERRAPGAAFTLTVPAFVNRGPVPRSFMPVATGLEASQTRRLARQAARRRRFATRTLPAVALLVGSATMIPIHAFRQGGAPRDFGPLTEDPPSLSFGLDLSRFAAPEVPSVRAASTSAKRASVFTKVAWHHATSVGLQYSGSLVDGTQLPVEGPDWVTWNPVTDSVPNLPWRLYGNERTIRTVISVFGAYRAAHPDAPRLVVGDISLRHGGRMDEHVSHQNGLDVDVYYPRLDRHLSAPIATSQIDRALSQDLLDRFVAAGAQMIFVGYSTGLRGPSGVVVPYPNHENHMHVRFPLPA